MFKFTIISMFKHLIIMLDNKIAVIMYLIVTYFFSLILIRKREKEKKNQIGRHHTLN